MPRRKREEFNTRKIQRTGGNSYAVTLPIDVMRQLGWREGQKVEIEKWGKGMIIRDWEDD
jgi:antitoxin component of MazEF toxin-antitoxin module